MHRLGGGQVSEVERHNSEGSGIASDMAAILANANPDTQVQYVRTSGGVHVDWLGIDARWTKEEIIVSPSDVTARHPTRSPGRIDVIDGSVITSTVEE